MQIELGLIAAVALMGAAVQLRILSVLHLKLQEITEEQKKRDEEAELHAAERFVDVMREQEIWEKEHPTVTRHGRQESGLSTLPLMKDQDGSASPATAEHRSSTFTLVQDGRPHHHSGISDLKVTSTLDDENAPVVRSMQSPGALPALDLGLGIQEDVPHRFIVEDELRKKDLTASELEELKRKEGLLLEIQTIRRSIDALRSETPAPSSSGNSRRPSMTSRRTLSLDANSALLPIPSHLRPPRESDPRARAHSLEMSTLAYSLDEPIDRPTSVPLRDQDWDSYVHDRKLLQPPAGVTPPITTTPVDTLNRIVMPQAVTDALNKRKQRESALGLGEQTTDSSDDVPLAKISRHKRSSSSGGNVPVTILPPRRTPAIAAPTPQRPVGTRTRTFEELNERHREKMRDLQAPLTHAQKEEADLRAARDRWEKSKALEKEAVTRRQAEKAAELEKRKRSEDELGVGGRQSSERRHSRSLSADKLTGISMSSKRLSTLKVEDWQKYQRDVTKAEVASSKRDSRAMKLEGVPFPDGRKSPGGGRRSRDYLS
jgi:hypothetical protein